MDSQQVNSTALEEVHAFIEKLIEKRNFPNLTPELKEELKKEALQRMGVFLLDETFDALSDEDAATLAQMIDEKKDPEALTQFSKEHIVDYNTFMNNAIQSFEKAYLEG